MPTAPQPRTSAPKAPSEPALRTAVRAAGLLVGAGPLALLHPLGVRIVWAVAVAALPLGIVLAGYHAWRRVCPLAFFATLGQRLKRQGKRKAGDWLGRHHLDAQVLLLALAMALRLLGANDAPWALAVLDPAPRTATLTALSDVTALVLDGRAFRDTLHTRPEVGEGVLQILARRLRSLVREGQT